MAKSTARRSKSSEPAELPIHKPKDVQFPSTGPVTQEPTLIERQSDGLGFKSHAKLLAFAEEPVTFMIHETSDINQSRYVQVGNNGQNKWLFRGVNYTLPRKFVEQLLRAKPVSIATPESRDDDGFRTTTIKKTSAMLYPLTIIEDKNPLSKEWQKQIMAEG